MGYKFTIISSQRLPEYQPLTKYLNKGRKMNLLKGVFWEQMDQKAGNQKTHGNKNYPTGSTSLCVARNNETLYFFSILNPFNPNVTFLYPLKILENR